MADTYAVQPEDVSGELPALAPSGFGAQTKPTRAVVVSWLTAADVMATLHVQKAAAKVPAATDQAAPLAKRFIVAWTKAQVMRAIYAGQAPEKVEMAAKGYDNEAAALLEEIDGLGLQMAGTAVVSNRAHGAQITATDRASIVSDAMLDAGRCRERRY